MDDKVKIEKSKDAVLRLERWEKALSIKIDNFSELSNTFSAKIEEMAIEVELLKDEKIKIKEVVDVAMKKSLNEVLPQLIQILAANFIEKTKEIIETSVQTTQNLNSNLQSTIIKANTMINEQHTSVSRRRIGLVVATFKDEVQHRLNFY